MFWFQKILRLNTDFDVIIVLDEMVGSAVDAVHKQIYRILLFWLGQFEVNKMSSRQRQKCKKRKNIQFVLCGNIYWESLSQSGQWATF